LRSLLEHFTIDPHTSAVFIVLPNQTSGMSLAIILTQDTGLKSDNVDDYAVQPAF
jgi:hypothetical protein